jgi:hypothetical protein
MARYEWDIEAWANDEPQYHDFHDRLSKFDPADLAEALAGNTKKLVLFRRSSVGEPSWAYVKNGKLPPMLADASGNPCHKVPIAYIREFEK